MNKFRPGFRFSALDGVVLAAGGIAAAVLYPKLSVATFLILFVVGHFFLFCNVFRIGRMAELLWAGVFVGLAGSAILFAVPEWPVVAAVSLGLTLVLIFREMRLPSYHGAGWRRLNPGLEEWWRQQSIESTKAH